MVILLMVLLFSDVFTLFMCILPVFMSVHHKCAWCPRRAEEVIRSLGTEVIDGCEAPCGFWELNHNPLEEDLTAERSFQLPTLLMLTTLLNCQRKGWRG